MKALKSLIVLIGLFLIFVPYTNAEITVTEVEGTCDFVGGEKFNPFAHGLIYYADQVIAYSKQHPEVFINEKAQKQSIQKWVVYKNRLKNADDMKTEEAYNNVMENGQKQLNSMKKDLAKYVLPEYLTGAEHIVGGAIEVNMRYEGAQSLNVTLIFLPEKGKVRICIGYDTGDKCYGILIEAEWED